MRRTGDAWEEGVGRRCDGGERGTRKVIMATPPGRACGGRSHLLIVRSPVRPPVATHRYSSRGMPESSFIAAAGPSSRGGGDGAFLVRRHSDYSIWDEGGGGRSAIRTVKIWV